MATSKGTQTPTDEEVRYVSVTKTLNLRVDGFENIDDVKKKFSEFESTETNLQKVFFTEGGFENGQELDFEGKDGSNVHWNLHYGVRLQVNIKVSWSPNDKLISLDVYSWDTIGDVKSKFQDKEGTPAIQLSLFHDGKQLNDLHSLADYDIENHSTLDAIYFLNGTLDAISLGEDKILIFVVPPDTDPIQLIVKLSSTVVNLKRMIHGMGHYGVDRQILTFNGVVLENGRRLSDYNIQMGSKLQLDGITRSGMEIFVKTMTGRRITIGALDSSYTVATLKYMIKFIDGTPEEQQRLIFEGKRLENDRMLRDYNIQSDSTVHLVVKLCGC